MKAKKFGRKLVINKKTIVNLSNVHLFNINGGMLLTPTCPALCSIEPTCHTCDATCPGISCKYECPKA